MKQRNVSIWKNIEHFIEMISKLFALKTELKQFVFS